MTETITECPQCGFDIGDEELCRACGAFTTGEIQTSPQVREVNTTLATTTCPHCNFESSDDELCQACGGSLFEDTPVHNISFLQVVGSLFSWLKWEDGYRVVPNSHFMEKDTLFKNSDIPVGLSTSSTAIAFEENPVIDDVWTDPIYSSLEGNVYHKEPDEQVTSFL